MTRQKEKNSFFQGTSKELCAIMWLIMRTQDRLCFAFELGTRAKYLRVCAYCRQIKGYCHTVLDHTIPDRNFDEITSVSHVSMEAFEYRMFLKLLGSPILQS